MKEYRKDFPALQQEVNGKPIAYLDNAATTQKPRQVIDRIREFYERENANVGRSIHELADRATTAYMDARKKVADFIGADTGELVFVRNTTEAVNLVAGSLELAGNIVIPELAHHSEQLPWRRKAEKEGLEIEYIPTTEYSVDAEKAGEIIDDDTALVSIPHVSNVFGTETDVKKIVEQAHEHDALVFLDAAQSLPRIPVDVKELNVDFLAFSGHKLCGPTGIGGLYARKELLDEMDPYQVGGGMIESVAREEATWADAPEKFEAGTPHIAGAVGLASAVEYVEGIGPERIDRHEKKLNAKAVEELEKIDGVKVYAPDTNVSVVSFSMENAHPHDIAEILNSEGIAIRAGNHCAQPQMEALDMNGTARMSPYIYNTEEEIDRFVEAVKKVKEVFS